MSVFTSKPFIRLMNIIGICTALAFCAIAVLCLIFVTINPFSVVSTVYQVFFGFLLILAEFRIKIVMKWFRFLVPYVGLGLFYIFVAAFTVSINRWWQWLVAAVGFAVGIVYLIMGCCGVTRMELPDNLETLERDMAVKYATKKAQEQNTPENRSAAASAAVSTAATLEEGHANNKKSGANPNPFESDNPFNDDRAYS